MNWDAIGAIAEVLGAVGVIATLGYLAYQIRQNTTQLEQSERSAQASAITASNASLRENRMAIAADAELSKIFYTGNSDPSELAELDLLRYRLIMQNVTESLVEIYTQTFITDFSPETWRTQGVTAVQRLLRTAGGRWFWESFSDNYRADFRAEVDEILDESP